MAAATSRDVMEERIKRMLELDRLSGDVQAQLRQSRRRALAMPTLAPELLDELDEFDDASEHPDFVEYIGEEPLIERPAFAADKYRSLRLRMGSHGPCCHRKYLHIMLDSVEDDEDAACIPKAMRTSFDRHMKYSAGTAEKIVRAYARSGKPEEALTFVSPDKCANFRLPVDAPVLAQLMLELSVAGNADAMDTLLAAMLRTSRQEMRPGAKAMFHYVRGMAELGNIESVMRGVLLARRLFGNVAEPIFAAAAPCLADLGADLAPESATGVRRVWRVFGLVAGFCNKAARDAGVDPAVFSVNPELRAAARAADAQAVAKAGESLPDRVLEAFDALSGAKAPPRTFITLNAVAAATLGTDAGAPEAEADEAAVADADADADAVADADADAAADDGATEEANAE